LINLVINLVIDRVASEIELPAPDPARWQEQLKEWGIQARRGFQRHPGVGGLTLGRVPVGPNFVRMTEWVLGLLRGAGIPLFSGGPDERFELGLEVIIRGLASYIER
jgi:hypothetical protein